MQPLPRKTRPAGDTSFSMFFGLTVSRQALTMDSGHSHLLREKKVSIGRGYGVSPHVIDLKPVSERAVSTRASLDFEQKVAIWIHNVRAALNPGFADREYRISLNHEGVATSEAPIAARPRKLEIRSPKLDTNFKAQAQKIKPIVPRRLAIVEPAAPHITVSPLRPMPSWPRQLATFAVIAGLVTLPVYALATYSGLLHDATAVAAQTKDAFMALASAGKQASGLDAAAKTSFDRAAATFAETRGRLRSVDVALAALASGKTGALKDGDAVLAAGESISKAGSEISDAFDALDKTSDQKLPARVGALVAALGQALPHLDEAVAKLDGVTPESLPQGYRAQFTQARADLGSARDNVRRFTDAAPAVLKMLGAGGSRRYLVLFQNERELRPTGGFIGSFALMDIEDGRIVNMEIPPGGPYDLRAGLNERLLAPPQLRLVNTRWEFQDANWFADFPTSAKTLAWFYEKSGGPTVDGVVAVTSRLMERLLKVVGAVDLPEYGKTITADNFFSETQKAVELEYDKTTNKPKQFIADLAPKVLAKLFEGGDGKLPDLMTAASDALSGKDIQLWFTDEDGQAAAASFGWTGEMKPAPNADFLSVIDANIAGGKTDGVVSENVKLESAPDDTGAIIDTVTITRTHRGVKGDLFSGIKNIDYVRVFVPSGSELLSAEGFDKPADAYFQKPDDTLHESPMLSAIEGRRREAQDGTLITEEAGLTVFGNWIQLDPGETRVVKLSYRLPYRFIDLASAPETGWDKTKDLVGAYVSLADWKLVVRRQAGGRDRTFSALVRLPNGWSVKSRVPEMLSANGEGVSWVGPLDRDLYLGAVLANER